MAVEYLYDCIYLTPGQDTGISATITDGNDEPSLNDAYDIFDAWLDDGNTATDFIPIILDIYRVSGLISKDAKEDKGGKN